MQLLSPSATTNCLRGFPCLSPLLTLRTAPQEGNLPMTQRRKRPSTRLSCEDASSALITHQPGHSHRPPRNPQIPAGLGPTRSRRMGSPWPCRVTCGEEQAAGSRGLCWAFPPGKECHPSCRRHFRCRGVLTDRFCQSVQVLRGREIYSVSIFAELALICRYLQKYISWAQFPEE